MTSAHLPSAMNALSTFSHEPSDLANCAAAWQAQMRRRWKPLPAQNLREKWTGSTPLSRWYRWRKKWTFQIDILRRAVSAELLQEGFTILDELFFAGTLSCLPPVILDHTIVSEHSAAGLTDFNSDIAEPVKILIDPHHEKLLEMSRGRSIICTLLHEMAHAFVCMYSCSWRLCGSEQCSQQQDGGVGHQEPWAALAAAIERHGKMLLGEYLHLSIERSAYLDRARSFFV